MARYSGSGGVGRRIVDDAPLSDSPITFGKRKRDDALIGGAAGAAAGGATAGALLIPDEYRFARDEYRFARDNSWAKANIKVTRRGALLTGLKGAGRAAGGGAVLGAAGGVGGGMLVGRSHDNRAKRRASVGKAARYYDPEHRRQRRLGMAEAGLAGGGAASAALGVRGTVKDSQELRNIQLRNIKGKDSVRLADTDAGKGALKLRGRNAGLIAAGAMGLGGAGLVRQKAEGRKFGIWR